MSSESREETEKLHRAYLRRRRVEWTAIILTQGLILLAILALWELGASAKWFNDFLTSKPSNMWALGLRMLRDGSLLHHTTVTLVETMLGFSSGAVLGILVAILLWWSPFLARTLDTTWWWPTVLPRSPWDRYSTSGSATPCPYTEWPCPYQSSSP